MYGRTYRQMYGNLPLCPTGHQPFGAAAQKARLTDGQEDGLAGAVMRVWAEQRVMLFRSTLRHR